MTERVPLHPDEADEEPVTASADEIREGIDRDQPGREDQQGQERPQPQQRTRDDVEEEAVQRMVEKLREKGKSDKFIQDHMDEIRDRVRQELSR